MIFKKTFLQITMLWLLTFFSPKKINLTLDNNYAFLLIKVKKTLRDK
jgi:hypothetical protein